MIQEITKEIINKHVDEYEDELRFDFIYLDHHREIKEIGFGKFNIQDMDIIIDRNQSYDEVLRHPIEDFFIPEKVNLFVVEFILTLEMPNLEKLIDFDTTGVIREEEISLADPRISDKQLKDLINQTCFDIKYQNSYPEVSSYLKDVYKQDHALNIKNILSRIHPFLGI